MNCLNRWFLVFGLLSIITLPVVANDLKDHPSPYLAMHGDDPVEWREWGEAAIDEARKQGKPLFVSIGYFACHWCHVMQRESYANAEIAAFLNKNFISVKVDRELRPALDAALIEFVQRTQGHAGWPLNVFLTPDGAPLVGLVYQPPKDFLDIVKTVSKRWKADSKELQAMASAAVAEINGLRDGVSALDEGQRKTLVEAFQSEAMRAADLIAGGFGNQNKFPSVPQLTTLLAIHKQKADSNIVNFVGYTLFMMASQGLRDQLGGGFFRYTTDPSWQTPHFEKMLYDNAQLASLYLEAAVSLERPQFKAVAFETLDFVMRDLAVADGAYAASLSAVDDDGVEGGGYLWDSYELKQLLSKDQLAVLNVAWKLHEAAEFEAGHLPIQSAELTEIASQLTLDRDTVIQRYTEAKTILLKARKERIVPRDGKRVSAWNGLMLSALVQAGGTEGGERFQAPATALAKYLMTKAWRVTDSSKAALLRAVDGDRAIGKAGLEDYALVARGLIAYARLAKGPGSGWDADTAVLAGKRVRVLVEQALARFYVGQRWRLTENALVPLDISEAMIADGAIVSASAALLDAGLVLTETETGTGTGTGTGDGAEGDAKTAALHARLLAISRTSSDTVDEAPFGYASHIRQFLRDKQQ